MLDNHRLQQGGYHMIRNMSGISGKKEIHPGEADGSSRLTGKSPFSVPGGTENIVSHSFTACKSRVGRLLDIESLMEYLRERGKITDAEYADYSAKFTE